MAWSGKLTQCLLGSLTALMVAIMAPEATFAHADYERAEPAADAVVTAAPTQVQIWFTQDLFRREGMNRIEVYDATGQRVDEDDPTIDDDNRRLMTVSLQPDLADGVYTVRWYSLSSEDGHEGEGEFRFTLDSTGTLSASSQMTATVEVTPAEPVSATVAAEPMVEASPTAAPDTTDAAVAPTATPGVQSPSLPCLGGAAPLVFALGGVLARRRRLE